MSRKSIASRISKDLGKPVTECMAIVDSVFDAIRAETNHKDRLIIKGFGSFIIKDTQSRNGRNPKTGEKLVIQGKRKVKFFSNPKFLNN